MNNQTEILKSIAPLFAIILLAFFVGKFTYSKVDEQNISIKKIEKENNSMQQRVKVLETITPENKSDVNITTRVLPDTNSSLAVVSQIKNASFANGLKLGGLKAGSEIKDSSGLSRVDVSFDVEGPKPQILAYISMLKSMAPIMNIDKVKLSEVDLMTRANLTVRAYWTAFPKNLPTINEKLTELTDKEIQFLLELENLTPPQFASSELFVETTTGREDPFTQ